MYFVYVCIYIYISITCIDNARKQNRIPSSAGVYIFLFFNVNTIALYCPYLLRPVAETGMGEWFFVPRRMLENKVESKLNIY